VRTAFDVVDDPVTKDRDTNILCDTDLVAGVWLHLEEVLAELVSLGTILLQMFVEPLLEIFVASVREVGRGEGRKQTTVMLLSPGMANGNYMLHGLLVDTLRA